MMKKLIYPVFCCVLFSFACSNDDDNHEPVAACGVNDVLTDLPWLAAKKDAAATGSLSEYSYLVQAEHKGETVFYFGSCCPLCNWAIILYDCSGNKVEYDASNDELKDGKVICEPENSTCEFD